VLRKTKKIENDQDSDPKEEGSDLENLSPENEILAQPLKPFFTEGFCKKLFSYIFNFYLKEIMGIERKILFLVEFRISKAKGDYNCAF
jgi:hypothetical protein